VACWDTQPPTPTFAPGRDLTPAKTMRRGVAEQKESGWNGDELTGVFVGSSVTAQAEEPGPAVRHVRTRIFS
jgi:hypothetical protein